MKKLLLLLILLFPFISVNALTLCDGTELPDYTPVEGYDNYIITLYKDSTSEIYRLYTFKDTSLITVSNNVLTISNSFPRRYTLSNGVWGSLNNNSTQSFNITVQIIVATTVDIIDSGGNILYEENYNLVCTSPEPEIPQDFSIINTIASGINSFVVTLQNNSIGIHVVFISLLIFNFLVFVLCYLLFHLE